MQSSPDAVFRLMMACKDVSLELSSSSKEWWWNMFYEKVLKYQLNLVHSNFKHNLIRLSSAHQSKKKRELLQAVFGRQCHFCKARFGHRLIQSLGIRACPRPCLRENLVSNIVLLFRYGISFADNILSARRRMLVFHTSQLRRKSSELLHMLTLDPYDYQYLSYHINYRGMVCFFLREDVGLDKKASDEQQQARRMAAQFLSSRLIRAVCAQRIAKALSNEEDLPMNIISHGVHRSAMHRRNVYPALPSSRWLAGGAHWSVLARDNGELAIRVKEEEAVARVKTLVEQAWIHTKISFDTKKVKKV